jgi:hypothetical protein
MRTVLRMRHRCRILAAQPDISVHHMLDPNQDRLMLRMMSYFRLKYRRVPVAYRNFPTECLPRGGTLHIADGTLRWPVTRTSGRSVFQFGAAGGLERNISAAESGCADISPVMV